MISMFSRTGWKVIWNCLLWLELDRTKFRSSFGMSMLMMEMVFILIPTAITDSLSTVRTNLTTLTRYCLS
jgi:hypothetical protein